MLALFFEVRPRKDGGWERYLAVAAGLRPVLAQHEGMLFLDRYRSLAQPGTILSHSLWRDEAALAAWRANHRHHAAQSAGRQEIFDDYRLRIAHVLRVVAPGGPSAPIAARSNYRDPSARPARFVVVATGRDPGATGGGTPVEAFESLNREGERLWLFKVADEAGAYGALDALRGTGVTARACEVERDYGMFDRAEAPQYAPPVLRFGGGRAEGGGDHCP